ncbi:unnamed protein product [Lactuca virosa]|uniref:Uncharacterized protein n=1 Tax=Lactuca virosa TaxID=75947 RepID=A0AAU9PKD3_9ASTR|nr:unnamed protein product [Lactuca virosa]
MFRGNRIQMNKILQAGEMIMWWCRFNHGLSYMIRRRELITPWAETVGYKHLAHIQVLSPACSLIRARQTNTPSILLRSKAKSPFRSSTRVVATSILVQKFERLVENRNPSFFIKNSVSLTLHRLQF